VSTGGLCGGFPKRGKPEQVQTIGLALQTQKPAGNDKPTMGTPRGKKTHGVCFVCQKKGNNEPPTYRVFFSTGLVSPLKPAKGAKGGGWGFQSPQLRVFCCFSKLSKTEKGGPARKGKKKGQKTRNQGGGGGGGGGGVVARRPKKPPLERMPCWQGFQPQKKKVPDRERDEKEKALFNRGGPPKKNPLAPCCWVGAGEETSWCFLCGGGFVVVAGSAQGISPQGGGGGEKGGGGGQTEEIKIRNGRGEVLGGGGTGEIGGGGFWRTGDQKPGEKRRSPQKPRKKKKKKKFRDKPKKKRKNWGRGGNEGWGGGKKTTPKNFVPHRPGRLTEGTRFQRKARH